jgi:hypothetical protein
MADGEIVMESESTLHPPPLATSANHHHPVATSHRSFPEATYPDRPSHPLPAVCASQPEKQPREA